MISFHTIGIILTFAIGQVPTPDSLVVPVVTDTTVETEILIFPPKDAPLPILYQVAWGDGDTLDWTGPIKSPVDISRYHKYREHGEYLVRVRAQDGLGRVSDWGKPYPITVTEPVQKWYFETTDPIVASPALDANGNIYFGDESGTFYSVTPDGRLRWTFKMRDAVYASALVINNLIYVGSVDSNLYCLDTLGKLRWQLDLDDEVYSAAALGHDGTVYVPTDGGTLCAVAPNGKLRWKFKAGDEMASSPTIGPDGLIYITADSVYCLDAKKRRRWAFGTPDGDYFYASVVVDHEGNVLVGNTDGYLYCLGRDGRLQWRAPVPDQDEVRSEVAFGTDTSLYFGSDGYYLCRKSPFGTPTVIYEADDILIATPAISEKGTVWYLPDDGVLYGLTASGRLLWKRDVASGGKEVYYTSSPTIAPDGTIYVGSWDNGLYAFRGDGPPAATLWPQYRQNAQHTGQVPRAKMKR